MKQSIVVIALIGLVVLVSGCTIGCNQYAERDVCIEISDKEIPCLSHIIRRLPQNYTDEEALKFTVVIGLDYCIGGIKICNMYDDSISEPTIEEVFNGTKIVPVCVKNETRLVCVD